MSCSRGKFIVNLLTKKDLSGANYASPDFGQDSSTRNDSVLQNHEVEPSLPLQIEEPTAECNNILNKSNHSENAHKRFSLEENNISIIEEPTKNVLLATDPNKPSTSGYNIDYNSKDNKHSDYADSDISEPYQDSGSEYEPPNALEENDESSGESEMDQVQDNHSHAMDVQSVVPKGKRRRSKKTKVNKLNWRRATNKTKRMKGDKYESFKRIKNTNTYEKIERGERKMGPACDCKLSKKSSKFFCSSFTESDRQLIFYNFWQNLNWDEKKIYVTSLVDTGTVKYRRTDIQSKQKKASYIFHLKKDNVQQRVCKKMFLETIAIGEWSIQSWIKQNTEQVVTPLEITEELEKQPPILAANARFNQNNTNKSISKDKEYLIQFLKDIPKMESHYCRRDTAKLYLEPQWRNLNELYKFYTKECLEKHFHALNHTTFRQEFFNQNLSLYKPKKDQCDTCTGHSVGTVDTDAYQAHIKRKQSARAEKESQKGLARGDTSKLLFTMDMQSVLTAPRLQVSASYYKMKLVVHNFTFFNLVTGKGDCYIWHEGAGGVTSNEFTSIICNYIERYSTSDTKSVIMFSDGCGYQNRNVNLSNALSQLAQKGNIEIFQYYLEKGHTQMECDSMHACIERKLTNREIYVPGCYVQVCKNAKAKDPYEVHYIPYSFFSKVSVLNAYSSIRSGNTTQDPKVTDIRALAYRCDGTIDYKVRYEDNWKKLPRRKKNNQQQIVPKLYNESLKIKGDKYKHLQELKKYIPEDFRSFYENLLHE